MLADLRELVLPGRCAACGRRASVLCPRCQVDLMAVGGPGWPHRVWPTPAPPGLPPTFAAAPLVSPLRGLLTSYKDGGRRDLTTGLAPLLAGAIRAGLGASSGPPLLMPVPSSRSSRRRRGDRPLEGLALAAAALLPEGTRVIRGLRPVRAVADQSKLDHVRRWDNLAASMALVPGALPAEALTRAGGASQTSDGAPDPALVVIVDDIMTTGATLAEAARAVATGGGRAIAAVVAATSRTSVVRATEAD